MRLVRDGCTALATKRKQTVKEMFLPGKAVFMAGRIQPENFCVCAPENCPLQGGAESWTYWATI